MTVGYALNEKMFDNQRVNFFSFDGNKNGSAKEYKFRVLPAYAPDKLFHKDGLHWGFKGSDGKQKALKCSLESSNSCPICDKVNLLRGQMENIDAALTTTFEAEARGQLEKQKTDSEGYINDHRRKPMYLWNVLLDDGSQKVLQAAYNPHNALFEKIKFILNQQKIDITSLANNVLMYVNRGGLKSKTRYQYEMLQGFEKDLSVDVTSLTDLSKVYLDRDLAYLQYVVDNELLPIDKADPNDRNFDAKPATHEPQQEQVPVANAAPAAEAPTPAPQAAPVVTTAAAAPIQAPAPQAAPVAQAVVQPQAPAPTPEQAAQAQSIQPNVNLTQEQDASVANMMDALK